MTLQQCSSLIKGVLRGWFVNKSTLDKFSEGASGLLFDGRPVFYEDDEEISSEDMSDAIADTITDLDSLINPTGNAWNMAIKLVPMPTEQQGAANNDMVKSIIMNGSSATINVDVDELVAFPSSDPNQGTHKWIALEVDTGRNSILGVSYNGFALTQQDVNDAYATGCAVGSFVLYIKADEVVSTPKTFTLATNGFEDITATISIVNK